MGFKVIILAFISSVSESIVYCLLAYHPAFLDHDAGPDHPERADRVIAVMDALREVDWADRIEIIEAREATQAEVALAHDLRYVEAIRRLCDAGGEFLPALEGNVGRATYRAALRAVGAGLTLVDRIMAGEAKVGFAPVRPPGHHAVWDRPMGFCVFNNIAALAKYLQQKHGLRRIFIFDFDVHHGNGVESAFWSDPTVFYCSIHRDNLYPYNKGKIEHTGGGAAKGLTLNIPLPAGSGDEEYLGAIDSLVMHRVKEFDPEIVLVSAGFDAHILDPLGGMRLTTAGFAAIADRVGTMTEGSAQGRSISLLEGGYDLRALTEAVPAYLKQLICR